VKPYCEIHSNPCQNGGSCVSVNANNYTCACSGGYTGQHCDKGMVCKNFWKNFLPVKVRAMQNVTDYLRSIKFLHHRVQRVVQPRKACFFWDFPVFGVFLEKPVFWIFFGSGMSWKQDRHIFWISATSSIDWYTYHIYPKKIWVSHFPGRVKNRHVLFRIKSPNTKFF
jgi:hypothetical protein